MATVDLKKKHVAITGYEPVDDDRPLSRAEMINNIIVAQAAARDGKMITQGHLGEVFVQQCEKCLADLLTDLSCSNSKCVNSRGYALKPADKMEDEMDDTEKRLEQVRSAFFGATGQDPVALGVEDDEDGMRSLLQDQGYNLDDLLEGAAASYDPDGAEAEEVADEEVADEEVTDEEVTDEEVATEVKSKVEFGPVISRDGRVKMTASILQIAEAADQGEGFTVSDVEAIINQWRTGNGEEKASPSYVKAYLQHFARNGQFRKEGRGRGDKVRYFFVHAGEEAASEEV